MAALAINAVIDGGDGADTLVLDSGGTTQYQLTGVETIALENTADATFSAAKASGIETIVATDDLDAQITFATLGGSDLSFVLEGANANTATINADNSGAAVVNVTAAANATKALPSSNDTGLNLSKAADLTVTVASNAVYEGTIVAAKATSVQASGTFNGATINAAAATGIGLVATGTVDVIAAAATELNIAAEDDLDLSGATSNLSGLENLTVETDGDFVIGDLAKVHQVDLSGTGTADLGQLGAAEDYGVIVNAEGLTADAGTDALAINGIQAAAGAAIEVNAAGVLGDITFGAATTVADGAAGRTGSISINVDGTAGNVDLGTLTAKNVTVEAAGALGTLDVTVEAETADH